MTAIRYKANRHPSLKNSLFWSLLGNWGNQVVGTGVAVLLAALVGPKEFGIVSVAIVFLAFVQFFLDLGVNDTLVQRSSLDDLHADSAFWLTVGISALLTVISLVASGWWASANHEPRIANVLRVLSLKIPINGLTLVQQALMLRSLEFKSLTIRSGFADIAGGITGIIMAVAGFGIWALVGQQLGRDFAALFLLWKLTSWHPRFRFSWSHLKDLRDFSMKTFIGTAGSFVHMNIEATVIGLFFGPTAVGIYRLADRIKQVGLMVVTRAIKSVALPNLARVQNDPLVLKATYLSLIKVSGVCTLPIMIMVASCSGLIVAVMGPKWADAQNAIAILSGVGALQAFLALTAPLLLAKSKLGIQLVLSWSLAAGSVILMVIVGYELRQATVQQQVNGIGFSKLGLFMLFLPASILIAKRVSGARMGDFGRVLLSSTGASLGAFLAIQAVLLAIRSYRLLPIIALVSAASAGIAAAVVVLLWLEPTFRTYATRYVRKVSQA